MQAQLECSADAGSVPVLDLCVPGRMICKVRQDRLVVSIADDENHGKFGAPMPSENCKSPLKSPLPVCYLEIVIQICGLHIRCKRLRTLRIHSRGAAKQLTQSGKHDFDHPGGLNLQAWDAAARQKINLEHQISAYIIVTVGTSWL